MHLWFYHKRLISDTTDEDFAVLTQEELFHILWDDTVCRIRAQPTVQELFVNKYLSQVQQYTFLHLTHYDHVYTTEKFLAEPVKRLQELRNLVWQHIFIRDPEYEHATDLLDRYAAYIDANYRNIVLEWPDEYYRQARVAWVNLPDFTGVTDSSGRHALADKPIHPDDVLPAPWLRNTTRRGIEYYWNPATGESVWERPVV